MASAWGVPCTLWRMKSNIISHKSTSFHFYCWNLQEFDGAKLVYVDNAATLQKPYSVMRTLDEYYRSNNSNVHRGIHALRQRRPCCKVTDMPVLLSTQLIAERLFSLEVLPKLSIRRTGDCIKWITLPIQTRCNYIKTNKTTKYTLGLARFRQHK